jgi:hypothetical protein
MITAVVCIRGMSLCFNVLLHEIDIGSCAYAY